MTFQLVLLMLVYSVLLGQLARAQAACTNPVAVRPILFVHGWNEGTEAWGSESLWSSPGSAGIRDYVMEDLRQLPGYTNPYNYDLYFDGTSVRLSTSQAATSSDPVASSLNIPCNARFFSIRFYGWSSNESDEFNPTTVMNNSIITKAYELSKVLQLITSVTYVKDVVLVAHSMGALDSRAYMEGLGSTNAPCTAIPCPIASSRLPYTGEVAQLITLDGVNAGTSLAIWAEKDLGWLGLNTTNTVELEPGPGPATGQSIIYALNYWDSYIDASGTAVTANDLHSSIVAIISEYSDKMNNGCLLTTDQTCGSDDVVLSDSQSIQQPLQYYANPASVVLKDIPNFYLSSDPSIWGDLNCEFSPPGLPPVVPPVEVLHYLPCLADNHPSEGQYPASIIYSAILPYVQGQLTTININATDTAGQPYTGPIDLTLNGPGNLSIPISQLPATLTGPQIVVSATGSYSLTYGSGGPTGGGTPTITGVDAYGKTCGVSCFIEAGNWSLTFNVSFHGTVSKPMATTQTAISVQGDGATLSGSVNPNGGATTVWFEWGGTNALGNTTAQSLLGSGTAAIPYTKSVSGLASNSLYYFRIGASNSAGTSYGTIQSFTTLSTLPKPTLLAPQNGATNVSTDPQFSWTAITNATSYRIIVATSTAALPTDPTSGVCGVGCVLNQTPLGTSYTPTPGTLTSGTQYFWQVHARSPLQYGDWSLISSLTAGQPSSFALSNGGSVLVTAGNSGTTALTVTPLGGFTGQVNFACAVSGSPTGLTCSAPSANVTGASSTTSTLTVGAAATTPTGIYTATVTASDTTGKITASTSVSITVSSAGKTTPTVSVSPLSTNITTAQPLTVNISVFTSGGPSPTGTVTVTIGSYTSAATPLVNASAPVIIPAGSLSPGTYTPTASYSGDSNYSASSGRANNSVTVTASVSGIATFTASTNTVTAGDSVTFTVTLSANTPTGTIVYLDSSANSVLPSGSIPIPAGSNTGSGVLTSSSNVTQSSKAVITASLGGIPFPQTQTMTVNPITGTPTITAFTASTNSVTAGGAVSFTVSLSQNAPPGTTINLSSSATSVIPNGSFTIPAGLNGGWTILTSSSNVTQSSSAVITASLGGVQFPQTLTITVSPPTIRPGDFVWTNYGVAPDILCDGAASVVLNNVIYVFGVGSQCQGYKFDAVANAWTQLPTMPSRQFEGGAAAINGKIYVVNGPVNGGQLQIYDPVANQWTSGSPPPTAQLAPAVAAANGNLYVIGDYNDATATVVQEYDPLTDSWAQKASMPTPRGYAAAAVINGIIYVIGGRTQFLNGGALSAAVEAYDPTGDTWTTGEQMIDHARFVMASAMLNNKLYLIGGSDNGPDALSVVQEYDPTLPIPYSGAENQWRDMNTILTARRGAVAGAVNGTVFVIGGTDANGIALTSVEQGTYTPAATPTLAMSPVSTSITTAQDLSAQVTVSGPSGAPTPTGSVVLSGGGYTSQSQSLSGGVTNFDIPAGKLAVGAITLMATYTPDSNSSSSYVTSSQSVLITVSAVAPAFGLTNSGSITVTAGSSGSSTLSVTSSGGFTGQVNIACAVTGLPAGLTCLAPAINVTSASAATSPLTVATTLATPAGSYTATVTAIDAATGRITSSTTVSITVNPAITTNQTITFGAAPIITVGATGTVSATASSGLAVAFTSSTPTICAISGSTVTGVAAGTCTIAANQAGNTTYNAAPQVTQNITVGKGSQTITFGAAPALTVGGTGTVSATTTSGLPVTFTSTTTSICTVSGSTVTGVTAGTCTIAANQAGNSNYNAAPQVTQNIAIGKRSQTITFGSAPAVNVGATGTVSATASSGLAVTFSSTTTSICTVSGSTVTGVAAGTCTIAANQAGNTTYNAAPQVAQNITVGKGSQTITFGTAPSVSVGGTGTVSATASSGLAVTFTSTTTSICTVSGSTVTGVAAGTCTIAANQAGNSNYNAAAQVTQSITVATAKKSQTITFGTAPAVVVGRTGTVTATASSGLAVTFSSTTTSICTVSGSTVTGLAAGTCTIAANQAGNTTYNAAPQVTQNITVGKGSQTITFGTAPSVAVGGTGTVNATASSGLAVTFTSTTPSICTVSGSTVRGVATGTCTIAANQPGNANYNTAVQVTQSFSIKTAQTITFGTAPTVNVGTSGTLSATASSGLAVAFSSSTSSICTMSGSTVTGVAAGSCVVAANQSGNSRFAAAPQITQTITIGKGNQTITVSVPTSITRPATGTVTATASSGLPVTLTSTTLSICTISGSTVTGVAAGTCTINANQSGNVNYNAAAQVTKNIVIH